MTRKEEVLNQARELHELIENHPYLSGLMCDEFHNKLNDVIRNGHLIDEYGRRELQQSPMNEEW